MHPFGVFVCALLCGAVSGHLQEDFVQELQGNGLDVGGGIIAHLDSVAAPENASLLERHSLSFDYGMAGLKIGKAGDRDAMKIGIYYNEGRGKKNKLSEMVLPALLGYKTTTMVVMGLAFVAMMVLKALAVAKMALVAAAVLHIMKHYFSKSEKSKHSYASNLELDHDPTELHPVYAEYGDVSELGGYASSASGNVLAYAAHTGNASAAKARPQYAYLDVPLNNTSGAIQIVQKRGDFYKRPQPVQSYITIKRKTVLKDSPL